MSELIVRGGTVVDGTGAPGRAGRRAGARRRDRRGRRRRLAPDGEQEIDARGAFVTPGLIDSHTHYDLEMFWDPSLDPLPSYGMTTIVMGNCGLGIAPVARRGARRHRRPALLHRGAAAGSLSDKYVPWGWRRGRSTTDRSRRRRHRRYSRSRTPRTTRSAASVMGPRRVGACGDHRRDRARWSALLDDALARRLARDVDELVRHRPQPQSSCRAVSPTTPSSTRSST